MIGAERSVGGDDEADGGIDAREFLDDDGVIDVAEARAAEVFRKKRAHEAQLAGMFDGFERKDLIFIPLEDVRGDFRFREFAYRLAKLNLFGGEFKFHGARLTSMLTY